MQGALARRGAALLARVKCDAWRCALTCSSRTLATLGLPWSSSDTSVSLSRPSSGSSASCLRPADNLPSCGASSPSPPSAAAAPRAASTNTCRRDAVPRRPPCHPVVSARARQRCRQRLHTDARTHPQALPRGRQLGGQRRGVRLCLCQALPQLPLLSVRLAAHQPCVRVTCAGDSPRHACRSVTVARAADAIDDPVCRRWRPRMHPPGQQLLPRAKKHAPGEPGGRLVPAPPPSTGSAEGDAPPPLPPPPAPSRGLAPAVPVARGDSEGDGMTPLLRCCCCCCCCRASRCCCSCCCCCATCSCRGHARTHHHQHTCLSAVCSTPARPKLSNLDPKACARGRVCGGGRRGAWVHTLYAPSGALLSLWALAAP